MPLKTFQQDPTARLDYPIDWSEYLEPGDEISSATAFGPAGITVESPPDLEGALTTVWVETEDSPPGKYPVTVHIVTAEGREDERSITINVRNQ